MTRLTLAFLAALAATTGTASAATLVGNTIDVEFNHNFARVDYWCAAGAAVISAGEPVDTMIYRTSPAHRSAGEGMSFSLDGNIQGPWNSFTAHRAANMCGGTSGAAPFRRLVDF
ncbi:MAG: hypothetical protein GKR99_12625 [Rhodobacteraceae bacterium]|nr:hypothetical protein [Paracoccaceae bacterium]